MFADKNRFLVVHPLSISFDLIHDFLFRHVILFQLALLPFTMCRVSLTYLASHCKWLYRFLPLDQMVRMHIYLGYVVVVLVALATALFFVFFGYMCTNDETFCDKFTSEIMCTGYAIISLLLLVGLTSYFRYSLPYEVFYGKLLLRPFFELIAYLPAP
jgi:hypothetical protein